MASFPGKAPRAAPEQDARISDRLTLALADRLISAALESAQAIGFAAAVAVVDEGGHLVAFRRGDGALFLTGLVAQRKAWTAASSGMSTEQWNELAAGPEVAPILQVPGLMAVAGGMPVKAEGRVIGGIGVSGGTAPQDRDAASKALATIVRSGAKSNGKIVAPNTNRHGDGRKRKADEA